MSPPYRKSEVYRARSFADRSVTELAYLAGIIDGEGHLSTTAKSNQFGIVVATTTRVITDWLHERFGGSVSHRGKTVAGNLVHTWTLQRHADLRYVLPGVMPYLVLKKGQAEAMLELVEHMFNPPHLGYEGPTSLASKVERRERTARLHEWRLRRDELRAAVKLAR